MDLFQQPLEWENVIGGVEGNRKIAVLISGGGTTLQNLIRYQQQTPQAFEVALVCSSSAKAGGLQFASQANIPSHVIPFGNSPESRKRASEDLFALCRQADVALVVLGGFLKQLCIPTDFDYRVINIHPALVPAFSGQGYYGMRVHSAVWEFGCRVSGCTVHFVDNEFDHGPILAQHVVPVRPYDTPATIQQNVFSAECQIYPQVIKAFLDRKVRRSGRRIEIMGGL